MTQKEFQDRTNIAVIEEMFWNLNEVYMTVARDPDEFCDIVRVMHGANPACLDFLCDLGYKLKAQREAAEKQANALLAENKDMKEFIYKQVVEYPSWSDIKEKACEILGKDEYYARLIEDDKSLPEDGKEYIVELLRRESRK
ncbi:MAG: hypothetical protein ACI3ZQ_04890 [Candidatus Cryptobacteroides sp.]